MTTSANLTKTVHDSAKHFEYKPPLDGLRAVAVLSVMAYHFGGADGLDGGFLGVDMFFVLSGYLITSLLLVEWTRHQTIALAAFWGRRARRLLPAILVVLIAIALWAKIDAATDRLDILRGDMLWTLFYGTNWHFIGSGQSYFDLFSEASPLRHAWSLAIEEQFYLVWPLVVFVTMRIARGRTVLLAAVCGVGIVASGLVMATLFDSADPSRAYYGTDARASQLLVGALLAVGLNRWAARNRSQRIAVQAVGYLSVIFCLWAFVFVGDKSAWLYYGGFVLFAVATAAIILLVITPVKSPVTRVLSVGWIRWIGAISYGLYLWHWPLQVVLSENRTGLSGWTLTIVKVAATFGVASLSYYLIEMPIRRGLFKGRTAKIIAPASLVAVALITLGATAGGTATPRFLKAVPNKILESSTPSVVTTLPTAMPSLPSPILLVGDSVADTLGFALAIEAGRRGVVLTSAVRSGCGLITGLPTNPEGVEIPWGKTCSDGTIDYLTSQIEEKNPALVLWHSSWESAGRIVDGQYYEFGTPQADAMLFNLIDQSAKILESRGAQLVLVTNPPRAQNNDLGYGSAEEDARIEHLNLLFQKYAFSHPEVRILDLAAIVCHKGTPCPEYVGGVRLRPRDGGHYEGDGPAWVAPQLLDALAKLLAPVKQPAG